MFIILLIVIIIVGYLIYKYFIRDINYGIDTEGNCVMMKDGPYLNDPYCFGRYKFTEVPLTGTSTDIASMLNNKMILIYNTKTSGYLTSDGRCIKNNVKDANIGSLWLAKSPSNSNYLYFTSLRNDGNYMKWVKGQNLILSNTLVVDDPSFSENGFIFNYLGYPQSNGYGKIFPAIQVNPQILNGAYNKSFCNNQQAVVSITGCETITECPTASEYFNKLNAVSGDVFKVYVAEIK